MQNQYQNGTMVSPGDLISIIGEQTVENRVMRQTITDLSGRLAAAMKELDELKKDAMPENKGDGSQWNERGGINA